MRDTFYKAFWEQKTCYNLFLLSKEELLDTKTIELPWFSPKISFPRIIVSNYLEKKLDQSQIAYRNEKHTGDSENKLEFKIEKYKPIVTKFLEDNFGESLKKISEDFMNPDEVFGPIIEELFTEDGNPELAILDLLKKYNLAPYHMHTFEQLKYYYEKEFLQKRIQNSLTDETYWNVLEFIRNIKDIYINAVYKSLYASNQVLINSLHVEDDFSSRIHLFELLFEAGILTYSSEEVFIECHNCDSGIYKGILHLKLRPSKLNSLVCPCCQNEVTYFAPFNLHKSIYHIINSKDGLLHDALTYLLEERELDHRANIVFDDLAGLEIDCAFVFKGQTYVLETKMFKLNTESRKLEQKIKIAAHKLMKDKDKLKGRDEEAGLANLILLVNITNGELLNSIRGEISESVQIMSLLEFRQFLT